MTLSASNETPEGGIAQFAVVGGLGQQAVLGSGVQNVSFGGSSVPVTSAICDPEPVFMAAGVARFTGRVWLADEIDRFIEANRCGYVFVEADAGLGKTAFAAWLVKTRRYASHFSRYSGGRLERTALQNLSAQLVVNFDLDDVALGGILPEWAYSPAGFESVLSRAAEQARRAGSRLVLVVDGLDEAEATARDLPFGLPRLLPDAVFVVTTYRTGWLPAQVDVPAVTVRISKDDPRNLRDIHEFLTTATGEEVLAARLAESGADPAALVRELVGRSEGVWIYLRYILYELRIGLRGPDVIENLPAGLRNYYASQIQAWKKDPAWDKALLPLLSTLGVAGEALSASVLSRLAGDLDTSAVRRLCDLTFRPLLTTVRAGPGDPLRYEIYHVTFRQVLMGDHANLALEGPLSSGLEALANELSEAAIAAHSRIADSYLRTFGDLSDGLPALAGDPGIVGKDDGYPLRHLGRHLHHAGRAVDLHELLADSCTPASDRLINVWFAAHEAAGGLTNYLDDLARARSISAAQTNDAIARREPAPALGTEIRYALMTGSIASRTAGIWPELLDFLIGFGLWSLERGIDHARRIADPRGRSEALMIVSRHASAEARPVITGEALDILTALPDERSRTGALFELVPRLPVHQRLLALTRMLDAAITSNDDSIREIVVTAVAPQLPAEQIGTALGIATAVGDEGSRARALASLAPYLPVEQRPPVLALALETAVKDEFNRNQSVLAVISRLPAGQEPAVFDRALNAVAALRDLGGIDRAGALAAVAPPLPAGQRAAVLARALDAAATPNAWVRAEVLAAAAPQLPAEMRAEALNTALDAVTGLDDGSDRAEMLAVLAPRLHADQVAPALEAAAAIGEDGARARGVTTLISQLPTEQIIRALEAGAVGDDSRRAEILIALAPHLSGDQIASAIDLAASVSAGAERGRSLIALALRLPAEDRRQVLAQALEAASRDIDMLLALVPHLPAGQQADVRASVTKVLARALDDATAISDHPGRAAALAALASQLPADEQPEILARALEAALGGSDSGRSRALQTLAARLPADQIARAVDAATAITDYPGRAAALAALALRLPAEEQPEILARALEAVAAIGWELDRVWRLTGLAASLNAEQMGRALDIALAIANEDYRAAALAGLAPHLPADQVARALGAAVAITDDSPRIKALAGLAPRLSAEQRPEVLARAVDAAIAITSDYLRMTALTRLVPHLPAEQRPEVVARALDAAIDRTNSHWQDADYLSTLAPHLSAEQMTRALAAATAIRDDYYRVKTLIALAQCLPAEQRSAVLASALDIAAAISDSGSRALSLMVVATCLPAEQRSAALASALDIAATCNDSAYRDKVLEALAPHLTADQLLPAFRAARDCKSVITALLARSETISSEVGADIFLELLRFSLDSRNDREFSLSIIAQLAPGIGKWGGVYAVRECIKAICDACTWWP